MSSASDRQGSYAQGRPLKDRAAALAIAVAVNVLLLLMLLHLASSPRKPPEPPSSALVAVALPGDIPVPTKAAAKAKRVSGGAARHAPTPPSKPVQPPSIKPPPPMPSKAPPLDLLIVSKEDLATTDRAMSASHNRTAANGEGTGSGTGSGSGSSAGGAPAMGRDHLYNAEWYRRPTDAEMATYIPKSLQTTAWGKSRAVPSRIMASRTVPSLTSLQPDPACRVRFGRHPGNSRSGHRA